MAMTDILSKISGQLTKSLVLGCLTPSALFLLSYQMLVAPLWPAFEYQPPLTEELLGTKWSLLTFGLSAFILTLLLYLLNTQIVRFYEGYPWRTTLWGKRRCEFYAREMSKLKGRFLGYAALNSVLDDEDPSLNKLANFGIKAGQTLNLLYPPEEYLILPTRLGNAIRCFEFYPTRRYGIDSIVGWPRLVGVIDANYGAAIDDAKTGVDFFINASFLAALLAVLVLLAGLCGAAPFTSLWQASQWLVTMAVCLYLSWKAYEWSIDQAVAWGSLVRGAFDLYRWDLLKKLGFEEMPANSEDERRLWGDLSVRLVYGDYKHLNGGNVTYKSVAPRVESNEEAELLLTRYLEPSSNGAVAPFSVVLRVECDAGEVDSLSVVDKVPDMHTFSPKDVSCQIDGTTAEVRVEGVNPFYFHVGPVKAEQTVEIRYPLVPLA